MQQEEVLSTFDFITIFKWATLAMILAVSLPTRSTAQQPGQKTFRSADEASRALVAAAESNDEKALLEILGPDGTKVVSSGDEAEDAESRGNFVRRYQQMHRLVKEPDGTTTLYVGAENWPMPIPVVEKRGAWYFDTAAGEKEILFRRIGRNEMSAIRVCQELASSEREYYSSHAQQYARKIHSDEGQQNGLYWDASKGGAQSPIGPRLAAAVIEGNAPSRKSDSIPFLGYYYHILTLQGSSAKGGAESYVVDGKMTRGFAFVAYPAEYRSSGVMTFIVNQSGIVYERDLGQNTEAIAKEMKDFDPGQGWRKTEDQQTQPPQGPSK